MIDPIVAEVRAARDAHARRFNYQLAAICADLRCIEQRCGHPLVAPPRKPSTKTGRR